MRAKRICLTIRTPQVEFVKSPRGFLDATKPINQAMCHLCAPACGPKCDEICAQQTTVRCSKWSKTLPYFIKLTGLLAFLLSLKKACERTSLSKILWPTVFHVKLKCADTRHQAPRWASCTENLIHITVPELAVGQKQWYHFGVYSAPPILVYVCGDCDVHWGYGILTWPFLLKQEHRCTNPSFFHCPGAVRRTSSPC